MNLQQRAEALANEIFVGGPVKQFENFGRLQLITLIRNGLCPDSKLLDVGCGCLRGGYWAIQFLNPGCYFGMEPNQEMLRAGIDRILEPHMVSKKNPRFSNNSDFDFSVFGEVFDYVFATSIWSHTSKGQIEGMLDSFIQNSHGGSVFLTTFIPAGFHLEKRKFLHPRAWLKGAFYRPDYLGDKWIGRSDDSDIQGTVGHKYEWIVEQCRRRGLKVRKLKQDRFGAHQFWLRIESAKPR